jgi:transposase
VEFKRSLAMKACEAGVSVARLALENRINANLLFKWRRQYRAGLFGEPLAKHAVAEVPAPKPAALSKPAPAAFQLLPVVELRISEQREQPFRSNVNSRFGGS